MLLPLFFATVASAADVPAFFFRESVAGSAWPTGVLSETRLQVRTPGYRSRSIVFQDTYLGAGLRLDTSPCFANPGVQVSIAPIDVFDIDLSASFLGYLPGPFGLLPYERLATKIGAVRDARTDHIGAIGWSLDAAPTLKLKFGPVILLDALAVSWLHITPPEGVTAPLVYEPLRDMTIRWNDVFIENQPIALYEVVPGADTPAFAVGGTWRDRVVIGSGDRSAAAGLLVVSKPSEKPIVPAIVGLALFYVIDQDRVGDVPFLALQANWILEPPLHRGASAPLTAPVLPAPG
jgi:hypothetical protein